MARDSSGMLFFFLPPVLLNTAFFLGYEPFVPDRKTPFSIMPIREPSGNLRLTRRTVVRNNESAMAPTIIHDRASSHVSALMRPQQCFSFFSCSFFSSWISQRWFTISEMIPPRRRRYAPRPTRLEPGLESEFKFEPHTCVISST